MNTELVKLMREEISRLKTEIADLVQKQTRLRALEAVVVSYDTNTPTSFAGKTVQDAILFFLHLNKGQSFTAAQLAESLIDRGFLTKSKYFTPHINAVCSRLAKHGKLVREMQNSVSVYRIPDEKL
jgi:hypothetical protein